MAHFPDNSILQAVLLSFYSYATESATSEKWKRMVEGEHQGDKRDFFPGEISLGHKYIRENIKNQGRHLVKTVHWGHDVLKLE